jgi:hypothetical protein
MGEDLAAIVVSYNTRDLTLRCLRALLESGEDVAEILVVDNGSQDGSVGALQGINPKVRVLEMGANRGFGAANNIGMRASSAKYFALVNSDAFVDPVALGKLKRHLQTDPKMGIIGPDLRNADGSAQVSRFPFPTPARAWAENLGFASVWKRVCAMGSEETCPRSWQWLSGACVVLRREVFEQTGGFDETFFLYSEETDWQWRIHQMGWSIGWDSQARVTHLGGGSGGTQSEFAREHFFRGVDRYFWKHHGRMGFLQLRAAMVVGCLLRQLIAVFYSKNDRVSDGWLLRRQLTQRFV